MKKSLIISLLIFWAATTAILVAGLVFYQNSGLTISVQSADSQSSGTSKANGINLPGGQPVALIASEVAKHNSLNDCWMIISDKVYNLTPYLSKHPGGASAISLYCGQDGTVGFQTKDISQPHSQAAQNLLAAYYLGSFGQTISQPAPSPTGSPALQPTSRAAPTITPPPTTTALTLAEVAKHGSASNCWMVISGKVYNFTAYISGHPGGNQMVPYCGQDGTVAFNSGPPHAHSSFADSLLAGYFLGNLNTAAVITPVPVNTATPPPASNRDRDFEDD